MSRAQAFSSFSLLKPLSFRVCRRKNFHDLRAEVRLAPVLQAALELKEPVFQVRALQDHVEAERGGHAGVGLFEADHFAAISDTALDTEGHHFVHKALVNRVGHSSTFQHPYTLR